MTENSNRNPIVSVIMPVYNCAQYVDEAIESMVNQTYTNMEIFIIDDCSTDGTKEKVESWAKLDERIKPIYKGVNTGFVDSLNMAIGLSNGEYIARMDGDDVSHITRLCKQLKFLENNKEIVLCGTWFKIIGSNESHCPPQTHEEICSWACLRTPFAHPSVMFRTSFLRKHLLFYNPNSVPAEDYELWLKILDLGRTANVPDFLLYYREHANQISSRLVTIQKEKSDKFRYDYITKLTINELSPNLKEIHGYTKEDIVNKYRYLLYTSRIIQELTLKSIVMKNLKTFKNQVFGTKKFQTIFYFIYFLINIKSIYYLPSKRESCKYILGIFKTFFIQRNSRI